MRHLPPTLLLLFLALAPLAGCDVTGTVERAIERELPAVIGPADHYDVTVRGLRASEGTAERVLVMGERVRPEDSPILDRLDLVLDGVRFDRSTQRFGRVDSARATARVTPADLAVFMQDHPNVRRVTITLHEGNEATLRMQPELAGMPLPAGASVEAHGRLIAEDGRIVFSVADLSAAGFPLAGAAVRSISDLINPLVDLTGPPAGLAVTDVRIEDGRLVLDATADTAVWARR
jgi:hypothetical protein